MKQIYSKMLLLIAMVLVGGSAWADDVTFTFKTDEDITYTKEGTSGTGSEMIVSKDDVTLSSDKGYVAATKTMNVYAKSTLTITAPGNITKIDLDYNGKVYMFDEAVGDGKKGEKYGTSGSHTASYSPATPATSITLNNPNGGKTELLGITVHYTAGTVVKVTGVSLNETSKTLVEGESFTLAATIAPANATNQFITWSSSDEAVAKVDKDGEVVSVAPGTATITVKTVDGNYTASCAVTVTEAPEPDEYVFLFAPASNNSDSSSSLTTSTALNKAFAEGYQYISSITADKVYPARNSLGYGVKFGSSSAVGTITINLKDPVPATYIVVSAAPYGDEEGQAGFTINGQDVSMENGKNKVYEEYVVKLDGSDLSKITLTQKQANKGRIYVEYIKLVKEDAYYSEKSLTLVAQDEGAYYGTFSSDKVTFFPEDYIVSAVGVENGKLYQFDNEEAFDGDVVEISGKEVTGYYVPANTGVLINSLESAVNYYTVEGVPVSSEDVDAINMLRPASASMTGDYKFYKLAYDDFDAKTALGFYYGEVYGAAFTCPAGLAYLAVPTASAAKSFVLNSSATAIENISNTTSSSVIYNLAGQRFSQLQKGINIVDGKKLFVK